MDRMERLLQTLGLRVDGVDLVTDLILGHLVCRDRAPSTGQPFPGYTEEQTLPRDAGQFEGDTWK